MRFKLILSIGVIFLLSSVLAFAALDLAFTTAITQSPDPASAGNVVTFTVSFRTTGGAVTNLKIIGGVDGTQLFDRTYTSIAADKVRTDSFTWTATAGSHTVWFELDPGHTCGDSNYANNRIEKAVTVGGGTPTGKPDLYISSVTLSPVKFDAGEKVTLTITVANKGTADAPDSSLFMKNDKEKVLMALDIPGIPKGLQYVHNIDWTGLCGTVLTIKVDTLKKADELDENNNTWLQTMKCKRDFKLEGVPNFNGPDLIQPVYKEDPNGPDLQVRIVSFKKFKHEDHEDLYISYEVSNWGKVVSVPCAMTGKSGTKTDLFTTIQAVSPGINFYGDYTAKYTTGGVEIILEIDTNNKNVESDEHNNIYKKKILFIDLKKK
jgi:subtilase family serine protease